MIRGPNLDQIEGTNVEPIEQNRQRMFSLEQLH
jgi:hypothetical protein